MLLVKQDLEILYRNHHEKGSRYGYLFCHGSRGAYLKEWVGHGKTVLDLGCRDGMLTSFYATGNRVVGADIDRKALELAEKKLGIETCWIDLNAEWPFAPHSFDVIVSCEILEHLFYVEPFLKKVLETLRPGGLFIGSVPNAFRMRNRWKFLFGREYEVDPTHIRQFSYHGLTGVLKAKFRRVEVIPLQGRILPFVPVSPRMPHVLQRLFARDLLWRCFAP